MGNRWLAWGLAVAAVLAFVLLRPLKPPPPEERVRQQVIRMARAAEEHKLGFIMDQVSTRFHSSEGWSRDELKGFLAGQLLGGKWVRVFTTGMSTELKSPGQVEFVGTFIFGRSPASSLKELVQKSEFSAQRVEATFESEPDGEWRVVQAAHEAISQEELLRQGF